MFVKWWTGCKTVFDLKVNRSEFGVLLMISDGNQNASWPPEIGCVIFRGNHGSFSPYAGTWEHKGRS